MSKKYVFFHNPDEENGYLSNWYLCSFKDSENSYTSTERYMMYKKAILFNDLDTAKKILSTSSVSKIKSYGREVKNFNEEIWDNNKMNIVTEGNYLKFSQNDSLRKQLLETGDTTLAECAVKDTIWGIGLSMTSSLRFDKSNWRGENLLGKCLMTVRERLKNERL